jgi:hypothetical protein
MGGLRELPLRRVPSSIPLLEPVASAHWQSTGIGAFVPITDTMDRLVVSYISRGYNELESTEGMARRVPFKSGT